MDYSYQIEEELDRQEAGNLDLSLEEYYNFLSDIRNNKVSSLEEWKGKNYGNSKYDVKWRYKRIPNI